MDEQLNLTKSPQMWIATKTLDTNYMQLLLSLLCNFDDIFGNLWQCTIASYTLMLPLQTHFQSYFIYDRMKSCDEITQKKNHPNNSSKCNLPKQYNTIETTHSDKTSTKCW